LRGAAEREPEAMASNPVMSKEQAVDACANAIARRHTRSPNDKDRELTADIVAALEALGLFNFPRDESSTCPRRAAAHRLGWTDASSYVTTAGKHSRMSISRRNLVGRSAAKLIADQRRSAAHRSQHRQAAGAVAPLVRGEKGKRA
jgi:hypothetical protein